MLRDRGARAALSATSTRSILDSVAIRLDEARDITRYLGNLLIFLGLLGTFWGLSNTVPAVVDTIRSLAPAEGPGGGAAVFDNLMRGLEDQLGGMGTAFASSLLGLAGSLVVGLLELFASHAQGRFYRELEEWLASITRIGGGAGVDGDQSAMATLVEQNAVQIETLSAILNRDDAKRKAFEARLAGAAGTGRDDRTAAALEGVAAQLKAQAEAQKAVLAKGGCEEVDDGLDDMEVRARLRSIDRQLMRLADEMAAGREDSVAELRGDLHALTRAVTALAEGAAGRRA
jgi:hypothetical protein